MALVRCILLATAPAIFWLWLFHRRDRFEPEPKRLVLKLFALGALAAWPAWLLEGALVIPGSPLFDNFVRIALVEEVFKFLPVWLVAYRLRDFNEPMDGILYAVAAALGFATVENVLYALHLGPRLLLFRAFTSTLAHVGFSGLVGYHLGMAKFRPRGGWRLVLRALVFAVALHGAYDILLAFGAPEARVTILVTVPLLLVLLWWAMRLADRASPFHPTDGHRETQRKKQLPAAAEEPG